MKKLFVLLIILTVTAFTLSASSISITPQFGYGLGIGGKKVSTDTVTPANGTNTKNENLYYNAGKGINFGLAIDYALNKSIALSIGGKYVLGSEQTIGAKDNNVTNWGEHPYKSEQTLKSSYIAFDLGIKLKTEMGKLTPFAGFGALIGLSGKGVLNYTKSYKDSDYAKDNDEAATTEYTFKTAMGFFGTFGAEYNLSSSLALVGGVRAEVLSFKIDKSTVTKNEVGGKDQLAAADVRDKETVYEEDDTTDDPTKTDQPKVENTTTFPANNITAYVGISLKF